MQSDDYTPDFIIGILCPNSNEGSLLANFADNLSPFIIPTKDTRGTKKVAWRRPKLSLLLLLMALFFLREGVSAGGGGSAEGTRRDLKVDFYPRNAQILDNVQPRKAQDSNDIHPWNARIMDDIFLIRKPEVGDSPAGGTERKAQTLRDRDIYTYGVSEVSGLFDNRFNGAFTSMGFMARSSGDIHLRKTQTTDNTFLIGKRVSAPEYGGSPAQLMDRKAQTGDVSPIIVSGLCDERFNGVFTPKGLTASGRPWYKNGNDMTLFWDPACDGDDDFMDIWMFDTVDPSVTAHGDLDNDNTCSAPGYRVSSSQRPTSGTWNMQCGSGHESIFVTIR